MEITRCIKGEKYSMPTSVLNPDRDGWIRGEAPKSGVLITLSGSEKSSGGAFASDAIMIKNGFIPMGMEKKDLKLALLDLHAAILRKLVKESGGPGFRTKNEMADWLISR